MVKLGVDQCFFLHSEHKLEPAAHGMGAPQADWSARIADVKILTRKKIDSKFFKMDFF